MLTPVLFLFISPNGSDVLRAKVHILETEIDDKEILESLFISNIYAFL